MQFESGNTPGATIEASGLVFRIGGSPATYCPSNVGNCPAGTETDFILSNGFFNLVSCSTFQASPPRSLLSCPLTRIRTSRCPAASKSTSPSTAPSPSPKHTPASLLQGHTSTDGPSRMETCNSRTPISYRARPPTDRTTISSSPARSAKATKAVCRSSSTSIRAALPSTELGNTLRSRVHLETKRLATFIDRA